MNSLKEINRKWFIAIGCVVVVMVVAAAVYYSPSMRFQRQQQEVSDFMARLAQGNTYTVSFDRNEPAPPWGCGMLTQTYDPVQCVGPATEFRKKDCESYADRVTYIWFTDNNAEERMMELWWLYPAAPEALREYSFSFNDREYLLLYQDVVFAPDGDLMSAMLQEMVEAYDDLWFSTYFGTKRTSD